MPTASKPRNRYRPRHAAPLSIGESCKGGVIEIPAALVCSASGAGAKGKTMYYEEQVRDGVLCYRCTPTGKWVPMTAERLTAMLLELRQTQVAAPPVFVPQPYPVLVPQPTWVPQPAWAPPWAITCGGAQ